MLAAMAAFFMFTVMNVFAKLLSATHSVIEIAFYRNLIACMPFLILVFVFGKRDILVIRSKPSLVGLRAVLGALSLVTTFAAFSLMPMAETTVLLFTASLFIPLLGVFFLGEHVGPWRWGAVVVGFVGVVIMAGPGGRVNALGIAVAIAAAMMHAALQIVLRYLGRYERPETITFYFLVIGTLLTALPLPLVAVTPTLAEVPLLFVVNNDLGTADMASFIERAKQGDIFYSTPGVGTFGFFGGLGVFFVGLAGPTRANNSEIDRERAAQNFARTRAPVSRCLRLSRQTMKPFEAMTTAAPISTVAVGQSFQISQPNSVAQTMPL
jgi:drug/metabolite transporter (DMT)-like permease